MNEPLYRWEHLDAGGDRAFLGDPLDRHHIDHSDDLVASPEGTLTVIATSSPAGVWLDRDAARGLRDALNELLGDDGGSAETARPQSAIEDAQAMHAAQHRQLEAACRRIAGSVQEQVGILCRLVDDPGLKVEATVGTLLGVQRRTVAVLGDLLAALGGEP